MKNNMEEEMGAFEEHALSEEDAKEAIDATEQKTQLISMIYDTETKFKYLLSLGGKDQEKVNELLVLEFIKLSLSIGEDIDQLKNEIEENSVLDQEERNLVFAAVTGLSPDDAMRYMDMTIEELEVILKTLYDELENNTEEMDSFDKMMDYIEKNPSNLAQEVLDRGHAAVYENDDGLVVKEFPDGRIFHIDVDLKTGETIYLKQLK